MMKETTKCSMIRWMHLVFRIPILGYINSPFENFQTRLPQLGLSSFL
jgi:hypothetical protein